MGNVSMFDDQSGCDLDWDKLDKLCRRVPDSPAAELAHVLEPVKPNEAYMAVLDTIDKERAEADGEYAVPQLGELIDGWKIQGYWYDDFKEFLGFCAQSMPNLTDTGSDNYIEMTEEQGFKFIIHFLKDVDGDPFVMVQYVPMEWKEFYIDKEGQEVTK
jgi:hypothetical protein